MGCDIHVYIEFDEYADDPPPFWQCWGEIHPDRHYSIFGLLAGVRGGEAVYKPRGLPDAVSCHTRWAWQDGDGDWHTPSWLTTEELAAVLDVAREGLGAPHEYLAILTAMRALEERSRTVARIIFWFDN